MNLSAIFRSRTAIVALGILAIFIVFEAGLRLSGYRVGFEPLDPALAGLRIPHKTRDFAYRPGFSTRYKHESYEYDIVINRLGLRTSREKDDGPFNGHTILAVGGSFTEAWGVAEEDAWPRQLEGMLIAQGIDAHVLNAGISAYNLEQIQDLTAELLDVSNPKLVVLGLRIGAKHLLKDPITVVGDADIQLSQAERVQLVEGGYLLLPERVKDSRLAPLLSFANRNFYMTGFLIKGARRLKRSLGSLWALSPATSTGPAAVESDPDFQLLLEELQRFHEYLSNRGIPLLVVLINTQTPLGKFYPYDYHQNRLVVEQGMKSGFAVVDPLPMLDRVADGQPIHRYPKRFHWPPATHALVAGMVADRINGTDTLIQNSAR